jgi:quercetin dioxygenase-like cupin family protein
VELGKWDSTIAAYKKIEMNDLVFQPGSTFPEAVMDHDMVCHVSQGELLIKKGGKQFTIKDGDVYNCAKGEMEGASNHGTEVAIMRFIQLTA